MRVAESIWICREPIPFRALCERAVPEGARYIVFDLDKTLHFRRNIGELLGWELSALEGYGEEYLSLEPSRGPGRFFLRWSRPGALLRYLWRSGRVWAPPGLFYLWWCRIAGAVPALRRAARARFGDDPVAAVQRVPQTTLFRQMARHPPALVRDLAARVLRRHQPDLIVEREDLAWLRDRCPGVRILLCSASPGAVVETAAESLGFDGALYSTPEHINSGRAKVSALLERHPDLPRSISVGISDNAYGEDASWTSVFSHLAQVNGATPFVPLADDGSPLRQICSAAVLTRREKQTGLRDRRRRGGQGTLQLGRPELEALLAPVLQAAGRAVDALSAARLADRAVAALRSVR